VCITDIIFLFVKYKNYFYILDIIFTEWEPTCSQILRAGSRVLQVSHKIGVESVVFHNFWNYRKTPYTAAPPLSILLSSSSLILLSLTLVPTPLSPPVLPRHLHLCADSGSCDANLTWKQCASSHSLLIPAVHYPGLVGLWILFPLNSRSTYLVR
jgi:hypothetical protein